MSEHCYVELCFRMEDMEMLSSILGHGGGQFWEDVVEESPLGSKNRWIKISENMASYGWFDPIHQAAAKGIVFYGYWGHTSEEPSMLFVSFGGKVCSVYEVKGHPVARLDVSADPFPDDVKDAKEYDMLFKLAKKYVEEGPDALNNSGKPPA